MSEVRKVSHDSSLAVRERESASQRPQRSNSIEQRQSGLECESQIAGTTLSVSHMADLVVAELGTTMSSFSGVMDIFEDAKTWCVIFSLYA